jgi:hypothetical protein
MKGQGSHLNLVPSCHSCNVRKDKKHPAEFATQKSIDSIMSYFNYVYYLYKRFRLLDSQFVNGIYDYLWRKMENHTNVNRIKVKSIGKNKQCQKHT